MKRNIYTFTLFLHLFTLSALASPRTDRIMQSAEKLNLDETQLSRLRAACDSYEIAESNLIEVASLNGIKPKPSNRQTLKRSNSQTLKADLVPKELRELEKAARKYHNRFAVLDKTIKRWGPSTNMTARAARQSMQSRLNETRAERDAAKVFEKQIKDLQKASKKDSKNLSKLRSDIEKYRDKAETEDFRSTCQQLLDILPVPN